MTIRYRVQGLSHMLCWIILILPPILKEDAVPHLTDEENIVPGGQVMCPRSHSWEAAMPGFGHKSACLQSPVISTISKEKKQPSWASSQKDNHRRTIALKDGCDLKKKKIQLNNYFAQALFSLCCWVFLLYVGQCSYCGHPLLFPLPFGVWSSLTMSSLQGRPSASRTWDIPSSFPLYPVLSRPIYLQFLLQILSWLTIPV